MPWYLEIRSPMGHWSPQLWADRPSVQTIHGTDYLRSTGGHSPRVRAVQEVPERLAGAGLKAVQTALSPDRVEVAVAAPEAKPVDLSSEALDAQVAALNAEAKGWGDFCSGKSLLEAALTIAALAAEREALIAATPERAAEYLDDKAKAVWADRIRALATQPQTDALAAVRREARAEGMRKAAGIVERLWALRTCREVADAILAAAEREAGHD